MTETKTPPATELGALIAMQVRWLRDIGAVIISRDDKAGRIVAAIPDAAVVEYTLKIGRKR